MNVGFIGLGNMGSRMASNLIKAGHSLVVHDVVEAAVAAIVAQGATSAVTPKEVAETADVIMTSLPGPTEVEQVALGKDGILAGTSPGDFFVDLSTNSVSLARRLAVDFKTLGVQMLDAPVSGGVGGAQAGTLSVMVGGDETALAKVRPLLEAIADSIYYAGDIGAGTVCKLVLNIASYNCTLLLAESMTIGVKAGVSPRVLWDTMRHSVLGTMYNLHQEFPDTLFRGDFAPRGSLNIGHKDIQLALEMANELGVPTPLSSVGSEDVQEAINRGWGDQDFNIVCTLQEQRAGVEIRIPDLPD